MRGLKLFAYLALAIFMPLWLYLFPEKGNSDSNLDRKYFNSLLRAHMLLLKEPRPTVVNVTLDSLPAPKQPVLININSTRIDSFRNVFTDQNDDAALVEAIRLNKDLVWIVDSLIKADQKKNNTPPITKYPVEFFFDRKTCGDIAKVEITNESGLIDSIKVTRSNAAPYQLAPGKYDLKITWGKSRPFLCWQTQTITVTSSGQRIRI